MVVRISRGLLAAILTDARADPVHERCGLLLGHADTITGLLPATNVAETPERAFELDPETLLAAHRSARADGSAVIGHYHSHPDGIAQPSLRDAAAAAKDGQYWLIVTAADWSCWRAEDGGPLHHAFTPVEVQH
jgi:desampylase